MNYSVSEVIRQLDLITEPHCRAAEVAIKLIKEQQSEIDRLNAEITAGKPPVNT